MAKDNKPNANGEGQKISSAPSISLPKGGGAIRGIGEKFAANPVTGTGSMSVPIATSPGRSGFGPQLALSYDSGAGNGPFGFGWSLSLPQVTRKTDKGLPQYLDADESDVFILSGAEDLVPIFKQNPDGSLVLDSTGKPVIDDNERDGFTVRPYRPRIEGLFARIERWTRDADGDVHWRSISKDNILTLYGKDSNSRVTDPADPLRVFTWLICETRDDKGNAVIYEYKPEDGTGVDLTRAHERNRGDHNDPRRATNRYLKRIRYGNRVPLLDNEGRRPRVLTVAQFQNAGWMFEIVLDYGEHAANAPKPDDAGQWTYRSDPFSSYRAGFEVRTYRLCQRVLMFHHFKDEQDVGENCLVRSSDFDYSYEENPADARNPIYSFLLSVTQSGYRRDGAGYLNRSLPPVEFEYTKPIVQETVQEVDAASLENLPIGVDSATYQWTDLHGEGIPGILTEQADAWFYKRNLSPISERPVEFAPLESVATKPNLALTGGHAQFMDLAGDGQPDVVVLDGPMPGLYEHDEEEGWQTFRPFTSRLNRDMRDPNLKFVDLDGDGHADVLITEDDTFVWHSSSAEAGFGPARRVAQALDEEKGPRLIFADGTQSIYLADLSGDGLTDLVRIRNGEVCYWPNLGYGRFGAKVTMDHAPWFDNPDQFDHKRIRLADIDGTGTFDIIYLHRDGVRLYFNQSGNSWSEPQQLNVFPRVDDLVSIVPTDLLGNGTACLVWSSPLPGDARQPMRYVNLMGAQKPHLLIKTVNNLGAETRVAYAPSTKFYLQDKQNGKPWITKLPFPVHVVERVITYDYVSRNRFVTRYAYHHGYFDGPEREFRGFGCVEQWDTEQFAALTSDDTLPLDTNTDSTSHVPPVRTVTWFHTGAFIDEDKISRHMAHEYFASTDEAALLPDTVFPKDIRLPDGSRTASAFTADEQREAVRALKGSILRLEIYAEDGSDKQPLPYSVSERNYTIECLQPQSGNRHAVFFAHPRETIDYHHERNPKDPRVTHNAVLEVDVFGNILKSVSVGYARNSDAAVEPEQMTALLTLTENVFTKAIEDSDAYRAPLPAEARTYELTRQARPNDSVVYGFADLTTLSTDAAEISYETIPDPSKTQKRLIECVRTLYRPDDLGAATSDPAALLPVGTMEPLALPGESYKLAFKPTLISAVYDSRVTDPMLKEGGYVHSEGDANWWIPSGRIFYHRDPSASASQELAEAQQHFFMPRRFRDPFGNSGFVDYAYDLLLAKTEDALGNTVIAQNDYRVLKPDLMTDSNGNRAAVAFDALGLVAGTAVMGKEYEPDGKAKGDLLDGFAPDLTQTQIDDFMATPREPGPTPDASIATQTVYDLLSNATTRIVYDLDRFRRTWENNPGDADKWEPAFAATVARETHVSDLKPDEKPQLQISFSYSDGFGREIQKKIQAEPGPVPKRDDIGKIIVGADSQPEMTPNDISPRWIGSGWTVFNNKGKPVRKYEPFFTDTHHFEFDVRIGVSPVLFYDPVERVVATLHPNHTYEKVVFDPWRQKTYDVNDTVAANASETGDPRTDADINGYVTEYFKTQPNTWQTWHQERITGAKGTQEKSAAEKAATHANTPTVAHFDTLGRIFLTIANNRFEQNGAVVDEAYETRINLDIEGNQREVIDAKGRVVMRYDYYIAGPEKDDDKTKDDEKAGNRIHQASMEAGERWILNDVAGKPLYAWDSRGHQFRTAYDPLRRPTDSLVREGTGGEVLIGRIVYGESWSNPEASNPRGKVVQVFDQAGVVTSDQYDFKGNLLRSQRQLAVEYKTTLNWSSDVARETEVFTSRNSYDALNRLIQLIAPHSNQPGTKVNVCQPVYNEANLLEQDHAWLNLAAEPTSLLDPTTTASLHAVMNIDYDAKGQRLRIDYGNGARTTYEYDPLTFRLVRLRTVRGKHDSSDCEPQFDPRTCEDPPAVCARLASSACVLQDLTYTYDPVGNITYIRDDAQQTIYFNNQRVEPSAEYTYDAVYRLIEATGREHLGQVGGPPIPHSYNDAPRVGLPHPNDGTAMGRYLERYVYDAVGNFETMRHIGSDPANPGWTRAYAYNEGSLLEPAKQSNRLTSTAIGGTTETYSAAGDGYDAHGNMLRMPHLQVMQWDFKDQLQMTQRQAVNGEDTDGAQHQGERTWYVYDSAGQRVRKVTERQAGAGEEPRRMKERIYLGGFEIHREYNGAGDTVTLERETLHIMDDKRRIALVETRTQGMDPAPSELIRYQFGNHLDSASLELDDQAQIISYEEYTPYGSTAYQAVRSHTETPKRYRYTGKERDEESGFDYYGARYYVSWIGGWLSIDPRHSAHPDFSPYSFVRCNPTKYIDIWGEDHFDIHEDGSIVGHKDSATSFTYTYISAAGDKTDLGTFKPNKEGLIQLPSSGISYKYVANDKNNFINPRTACGLFGASMAFSNETGIKVQITGITDLSGVHSGVPAAGDMMDIRYVNKKGNVNEPVWTSGTNFDVKKSQRLVDLLIKFGFDTPNPKWPSILTEDKTEGAKALESTFFPGHGEPPKTYHHRHHMHVAHFDPKKIKWDSSYLDATPIGSRQSVQNIGDKILFGGMLRTVVIISAKGEQPVMRPRPATTIPVNNSDERWQLAPLPKQENIVIKSPRYFN